jgi:hypothetical protein
VWQGAGCGVELIELPAGPVDERVSMPYSVVLFCSSSTATCFNLHFWCAVLACVWVMALLPLVGGCRHCMVCILWMKIWPGVLHVLRPPAYQGIGLALSLLSADVPQHSPALLAALTVVVTILHPLHVIHVDRVLISERLQIV